MRSLPLAVAALCAITQVSCLAMSSSWYTCSWLELADDPAVEVVARRVTVGEEAACTAVNAPGDFRIIRERYVVEVWNGDRYYPELYVKVTSVSGMRLQLTSSQFHERKGRGIRRANEFDYFFWEKREPYPARIEFVVVDAAGNELGRESLAIKAVTGGRFRAFY
ncbi:MAG: hypothetical protein AB7U83_00860 [Vicinamibacterales bacterium]